MGHTYFSGGVDFFDAYPFDQMITTQVGEMRSVSSFVRYAPIPLVITITSVLSVGTANKFVIAVRYEGAFMIAGEFRFVKPYHGRSKLLQNAGHRSF